MLAELYPRMHRRFTSLPVFGRVIGAFTAWLIVQGYSGDRVREYCRAVRRLDRQLVRDGVRLPALTRHRLRACAPISSQDDPDRAALVRLLERFFEQTARFRPHVLTRRERQVSEYATYLGTCEDSPYRRCISTVRRRPRCSDSSGPPRADGRNVVAWAHGRGTLRRHDRARRG
jgi:hypothetical protein